MTLPKLICENTGLIWAGRFEKMHFASGRRRTITPATRSVALLLAFMFLLAGCAASPETPASAKPAFTASAPAASTQAPSATIPNSAEASAESPSASPAPDEVIVFKPGGTSAYRERVIAPGEIHTYTLQAAAGQTLLAGVSSQGQEVYLEITGLKSGEVLLHANERRADWRGILPETQPYQITLSTEAQEAYYFLCVEVPADILFGTEQEMVQVEGYLEIHSEWYPNLMTRVRYLVHAAPGREITSIQLSSPEIDRLSLGIIGQADGQPYKRYEVSGVEFNGWLPLEQGYFVDVYSIGVSTGFVLEISVD